MTNAPQQNAWCATAQRPPRRRPRGHVPPIRGHGRFEIAGASADKPIAIRAEGLADFRPWLAMMTKVFRLTDYHLISLVIEGPRVSAHWRVNIFSKVTGVTVPTELVDLLEIRDDRIQSYSEFFVPR